MSNSFPLPHALLLTILISAANLAFATLHNPPSDVPELALGTTKQKVICRVQADASCKPNKRTLKQQDLLQSLNELDPLNSNFHMRTPVSNLEALADDAKRTENSSQHTFRPNS